MRPFDLQVNGYAGVDFCAGECSAADLVAACTRMEKDGVDSFLLTLITDTIERLVAKLDHFVTLREADPFLQKMIAGFHVEGPFLNPAPGFIGAHPPECVVPANVDDAKRLLEAGRGSIRLVTLAPECDPGFATTQYLSDQGITIAAGHCDPSLEQLSGAIDAGLRLVTHFGNGCPVKLARHDNALQRFLSKRSELTFCFIPDGAHVPFFAMRNYLDLIGIERTIMVTDAISAATLGEGQHEISGMTVQVDADGVARKPGSKNLAGSTITMPGIIRNLKEELGFDDQSIAAVVDRNSRRAVGM